MGLLVSPEGAWIEWLLDIQEMGVKRLGAFQQKKKMKFKQSRILTFNVIETMYMVWQSMLPYKYRGQGTTGIPAASMKVLESTEAWISQAHGVRSYIMYPWYPSSLQCQSYKHVCTDTSFTYVCIYLYIIYTYTYTYIYSYISRSLTSSGRAFCILHCSLSSMLLGCSEA